MSRKRKTGGDTLPPRVYILPSGSYRYKPKRGPSEVIANKNATIDRVWAEYNKRTRSVEVNSLAYLAELYYESRAFKSLKPRTQHDYRKECSGHPILAFEGWDVSEITPGDIGEYIERRGKKALRRANLELQWFKNVLGHGVGLRGFFDVSAAKDIKPLRMSLEEKAAKKKVYVTDYMYNRMLAKSRRIDPQYQGPGIKKIWSPVAIAMEISYCTGIRQGDVLKLRWEDIDKSMYIEEGKTGREYLKAISPRLKLTLEAARSLDGHPFGGAVVRNKFGEHYTSDGFGSIFRAIKNNLPMHRRFTFHDIRHKAITDFKNGDKLIFSMHSDAKMLGVYDHQIPHSPSH